MQSFHRVVALFSIVIAAGFFVGCGGSGSPVPGGSDPATEAAEAALAPEGVPPATEKSSESTEDAGEETPAQDDSPTN